MVRNRRVNYSISRRLVQLVSVLGLILLFALLGIGMLGLRTTFQQVRRGLDETGTQAARRFDLFWGMLSSDLNSTADALSLQTNPDPLLRLVLERQPSVFELLLVNADGTIWAQRRRVGKPQLSLADQPWLETVRAGQVYIGPVDYAEYGVPFVDVAMPATDARGEFHSLVVRVDLTILWDQITRIQVGQSGYAYITDRAGTVLIHPNQQMAGTRFSDLTGYEPERIAEGRFRFYRLADGGLVAAGAARLQVVPWYVMVEQPLWEALLPFVFTTMLGVLIAGGAGLVVYGIIRFVNRRIVRPLQVLREGVEMLGREQLGFRIEIQSRDEFGDLAGAFNAMIARIQELIDSLEQRIAERTHNLMAAAQVSRATAEMRDVEMMLPQVVEMVREQFDLYYVGLFLTDEEGRFAVLRAGTGEAGRQMLEQGWKLEVGGKSMIGRCVATGQADIQLDVGEAAVHFDNPFLPNTRSEMALPLRSRGQVIGAMTIQSTRPAAFDQADISTLQNMADQIAAAIYNNRLYAEARAAIASMEATQRRYQVRAWSEYVRSARVTSYEVTKSGVAPLGDRVLPEVQQAMAQQRPVVFSPAQTQNQYSALVAPIIFGGTVIGAVGIHDQDVDRQWSEHDLALVQAVVERMGQVAESLRLLDETQRREARERLTRQITDQIRSALTVEDAIQRALEQLGNAFDAEMVGEMNVEMIRLADGDRAPGSERRPR